MTQKEMWITGIEISAILSLVVLLVNQCFQRRKDRIAREFHLSQAKIDRIPVSEN